MTWDISWKEPTDRCSKASKKDPERFCTRNSEALQYRLEEETGVTWINGCKPSENFHPYAFLYFDHAGSDSLTGYNIATSTEISSDEFVRLLKKIHPKKPKYHVLAERIVGLEEEVDELNTRLKQKNAEVKDLNEGIGAAEFFGKMYIERIYELEEEVRNLEGENSILDSNLSAIRLLVKRRH